LEESPAYKETIEPGLQGNDFDLCAEVTRRDRV